MVEEGQLVERLAPKIEERIRYKIVKSIIDALEEQFYPPEETITTINGWTPQESSQQQPKTPF